MENMITTVNWHLLKACNMQCSFCYATFNDIKEKRLGKTEGFQLLEKLWNSQMFKKINFAGGEPTLIPYLDEYIIWAKKLGFETSIVTNGSGLTIEWLDNVKNHLDIIGLSVDSIDSSINIKAGRAIKNLPITAEKYKFLASIINQSHIALKINTVVNQLNKDDNLVDFINIANPFRWKILQATAVEGQNDATIDTLMVSNAEYQNYILANRVCLSPEIDVIEEEIEDIQGSYLMVDQIGRFYDSSEGKHNYSDFIMENEVSQCLSQIKINHNKFIHRKGDYSVKSII